MGREELIELIIARLAKIPISPVLMLFSAAGLFAGVFMAANPRLAIELQRRFYSCINWKIEPISLQKELRNTRIMGSFLILLSAATLFFIFIKRALPR